MSAKFTDVHYLASLVFIGLLLACFNLKAQKKSHTLSGQVVDESGEGVPFATISIPETNRGTAADINGEFSLTGLPATSLVVKVESVGYQDRMIQFTREMLNKTNHRIILKKSEIQMEQVVVSGKSEAFKTREKAYSVAALDARKFKSSNIDVGNMLRRVSGVNIREEGGLGSDFKFSINGLSGKRVKFFIDGVPMENYGSSYNINTIPVNLIERVEVYKGVVPVWLGRDALGGAVNIITRDDMGDYLDVSYSYGSFNTHKASLNGQYELGNSGIVLKTAAFYNYSDNDYEVDDIEIHDELGNVIGTRSFTRFHDSYESGMLQIKTGIKDKSYADKLLVGLTRSGNRNNVQHGLSLERVYGKVHTRDNILMPVFEYKKEDLFMEGLDVSAYASYIDGKYEVVDTSSREYNWDGSYTIRSNPNIGESDWQKSLFTFNDRTMLAVGNLKYARKKHKLAFNYTRSGFVREGSDPFDPDIVPFSDPNYLKKNIWGLSYTRYFFEKKLSLTPFVKYFLFKGKTVEEDVYSENPRKIIHKNSFRKPGYGFAATFDIFSGLKLKTSFENTYRLPDGSEIFGDGLNVLSNPSLEPEHSKNFNAGLLYNKVSGMNSWIFEANFFSRNAENLIREAAEGAKSQHVNLAKASIQGVESELTFRWNNHLTATVNLTWQNLVNETKYHEDGTRNYTYHDRLPNIPYLLGNGNISYRLKDLLVPSDALVFNFNTHYVHEFYLNWPSHGGDKHIIPRQLTHSAVLNYSIGNGKYNISVGSSNLLDKKVYDNFRVQKPGRAFYIKLRYSVK